MKHFLCAVTAVLCLVAAHGASAHEFWIEPEAHRVAPDDNIRAALRVGQDFKGSEFPFLESRFKRFTVTGPAGTYDVEGTLGDRPAANVPPQGEGLHILAYHSSVDTLTFRKMEKFLNYVTYEGNEWALEAHRAAGMPETGFKEEYSRNAKALVQVGAVQPGEGDRALGLPIELIAQAHPAEVSVGDTMPVQLLWQGAPLAGQRINIFTKGTSGPPPHVVTDAQGRAEVPLTEAGRYMLNAVHMFERDGAGDVFWESYWASLTFAVE
ncbi:DUF4198 domain-containing protein [Roseovarius aestuariivivens]|uniref:DUF4198 domain-containing protein n=1 Tax=Roseovarius aestuariivivens TaxID=1888910 RepID=UPI001080B546|nr:DUF4198 domain-containing protein [Roseovarius aestuariivivens]